MPDVDEVMGDPQPPTYVPNRNMIFLALAGAASVDAIAYHLLGKYPRWMRINGSNVPSALVDSIIFPTLAFGSFLWPLVLGQFLAKTLGGFVWSLIFRWFDQRSLVQDEQPG